MTYSSDTCFISYSISCCFNLYIFIFIILLCYKCMIWRNVRQFYIMKYVSRELYLLNFILLGKTTTNISNQRLDLYYQHHSNATSLHTFKNIFNHALRKFHSLLLDMRHVLTTIICLGFPCAVTYSNSKGSC